MGIEYDLVSDATQEGYQLGKGPWDEEFEIALRSKDPLANVLAYLLHANAGMGWQMAPKEYVEEITRDIVTFAVNHPDWRVTNDACDDLWVATDNEREEMFAENPDFVRNDPDFPIYCKVGSRYRR